jgi:hypothetical protein
MQKKKKGGRLNHTSAGVRVMKKKKEEGEGSHLGGGSDEVPAEERGFRGTHHLMGRTFRVSALIDRMMGGGVPREQQMLKGHLLRVIYHRVYCSIKNKRGSNAYGIAYGRP